MIISHYHSIRFLLTCVEVMFLLLLFIGRWFHGKLSREAAEDLLWPRMDGLFLVRESVNYKGDYSLSVWYDLLF